MHSSPIVCSTGLPIASTRGVWLPFSCHFPLWKFLGIQGIEPGAAVSGSKYASHCAMLPPSTPLFLFEFELYALIGPLVLDGSSGPGKKIGGFCLWGKHFGRLKWTSFLSTSSTATWRWWSPICGTLKARFTWHCSLGVKHSSLNMIIMRLHQR